MFTMQIGKDEEVLLSTKQDKEVPFEKGLSELVAIVDELENGKLSLEESIKKFEKGVTLYKQCKKILTDAEKKISVLSDSLKEEQI